MPKFIKQRSQDEVDRLIKNFMLSTEYSDGGRTQVSICGQSHVRLQVHRKNILAYRLDSKKTVFLGFYYSENLATDPDINFVMPPHPYFTYSQLLERAQEVAEYGYIKSGYSADAESNQPVAPQELPQSPQQPAAIEPPQNPCCTKKDALERRLRMLDLKIEREEVLNELAAL